MSGNQYVELIRRVLAENSIALGDDEIERMARLANKVRVPMREDIMRNFVAAYLRVVLGWSAKNADKVASSSRGRRTWENKIRIELSWCLGKCEEFCLSEVKPAVRLILALRGEGEFRGTELIECILDCMERECGTSISYFRDVINNMHNHDNE